MWWNVPAFPPGKWTINRDQQTKVITSIEIEALDLNIANRVTRAHRSLPKDHVDTGAFTRRGIVMSVKVNATLINRVQDFKPSIEKLLERMPTKRVIRKAAKINIKITSNHDARSRLWREHVDMWDEVRVIVAIRASHLGVHEREIDVDDVEIPSNADTVIFDRAAKRSFISGEVAKVAGNKRAPKDMRSLIRANACE
jgi:hypothetical protein